MKLVFLRILSSNLSLLCSRFLRTPQHHQNKPGGAALHTQGLPSHTPPLGWFPVSHGEHGSLHPGLVSLALSVLPGECELSHHCQAAPGESGAHVFVGQLVPVRHNVKHKR